MSDFIATNLFTFILGLAALILLHELGHFLVARMLGVEVEEFGIGFPPRLVKLFEHNGTEFTLNWIPLGGFVRPKGENDPDVPGGLAAASPWTRLAVLAAGPLMNIFVGLLLGILFFYQIGDPILDRVLIQEVAQDSPAAEAGLLPGDELLTINGDRIDGTEKIIEIVSTHGGEPIQLTYLRDGVEQSTTLVPRMDPEEGRALIGILMTHPSRPVDLPTAVSRGAQTVYLNVEGILMLPVRLASGTAQPDEGRLIGYKGLFDIYQQLETPIYFFMAISISLGVLNLMPIPALDGGRILLTLPEILLRRRIPPQYENMIHLVGFTLLLILIIYINIQDFVNPIELPR